MNAIQTNRFFKIVFPALFFLALSFPNITAAQTPDTLWSEDWEGDWTQDWHVDFGTWEVGMPTSGPGSTFLGDSCAATVLAGNYAEGVSTRLIRHTYFTVPEEDQNPYLRYYHWLNFNRDDYSQVQIKEEGGSWEALTPKYVYNTGSNAWSYGSAYLNKYAGKRIQIAYYIYSHNDNGGSEDVSSGSYIDNIALVYGQKFRSPENWETDVGGWGADGGSWEYGAPTYGPSKAHSGKNCVGTNLAGEYTEPARSRWVSLPFTVPPLEKNPALRFWHWFDFNMEDYGQVQIKEYDSDEWIDLENAHYGGSSSNAWTNPYLPLTSYSDKKVQIGFYFSSNNYNGGSVDVGAGWYIDDVRIEGITPPEENNSPFVSTSIPDTTFPEDSGSHLVSSDLNEVFSDSDGDALTFSASSPNPGILPSVKNDSLFVDATPDYFGNGNVIVTATDPGGLSARDTFLVEITPVNDAPGTFTLLIPADKDTVDILGAPIKFVWSQAQNVDSDTIWYDLKIFNATFDTAIAKLTDTTFAFNGENSLQNNDSYYWTVTARDRFESTAAKDTFLFYTPPPDALSDDISWLPEKFTLKQNYPNPFNPTTTIKYALPKSARVKLEVFNMLGQKVATLVEGRQVAGYHQALFNARNLPSGVYYYRLNTDAGFRQTKKMILIH